MKEYFLDITRNILSVHAWLMFCSLAYGPIKWPNLTPKNFLFEDIWKNFNYATSISVNDGIGKENYGKYFQTSVID